MLVVTHVIRVDGLALWYRVGRNHQVTLHPARLILVWVTVCGQLHHLGL